MPKLGTAAQLAGGALALLLAVAVVHSWMRGRTVTVP